MTTDIWSFPTRVLFGQGVVRQVGAELAALGANHALIVTDAGVVKAGLLDPITTSLDDVDIAHTVFEDLSSNPHEHELAAATKAHKKAGADAIVAVGGGSPLDVGKLVRLCATHPGPLAQYDDAIGGGAKITKPMPPMIAVPTTAGTGSEVGRSGVVTLEETNRKTVFFAPSLMPTVAILDPELTVSLPPQLTAATGFDALTHCIEAFCAKGDHAMADAIAIEGVRLVAASLPQVLSEPGDLAARGDMMKAAMMGAVAFQKGLGACHALSHPLSAEADLHHGLANAMCLPAVLDFNRTAVPERIARLGKVLGARGDDAETLAFECSGAVRALRRKVGLPEGLSAAGIEDDKLPELAPLAMADATHQLNPRACTEEDMLALYRASM